MRLNNKGFTGIEAMLVIAVFVFAGVFIGHKHQAYVDSHPKTIESK